MLSDDLTQTTIEDIATPPAAVIGPDETISKAIGAMKKHRQFVVPVAEKDEYHGLITVDAIIAGNPPADSTKAATLMETAPLLAPDTPLGEACRLMRENSLKAAPVGRDGVLEKMLSFADILSWTKGKGDFQNLKVEDIPLRDVPILNPHEGADKARVSLRNKQIADLLMSGEKEARFINEDDYAEKIASLPRVKAGIGERSGEKQRIRDIESQAVADTLYVRVAADDTVARLFEQLHYYNATSAGFNDSLITYRDILDYLASFAPGADVLDQRVKVVAKDKLPPGSRIGMQQILEEFMGRFNAKFGNEQLQEFSINVKETNREGERTAYELQGNLYTDFGRFHATKDGYDLPVEFAGLIEAIRRQLPDWD